jgi:hypothetical protein
LLDIMKGGGGAPNATSVQAEQPALLVTGSIALSAAALKGLNSAQFVCNLALAPNAAVTAQLKDVTPITSTSVLQGPGAGAYRIELRDNTNTTQFSYAFTPVTPAIHTTTALPSPFAFVVPRIANLGSVRLFHGAEELAVLQASPNAPTLEASFSTLPRAGNQGPAPSGDTDRLQITWQTISSDNAPVDVNLRYSADGGGTWQTIDFNLTGTGIEVDKTDLPASTNGLIEITANNRGQSATKILEIGPVANNVPVASIDDTSQITLDAGDPFYLEGFGFDQEDGDLEGNSLAWNVVPATAQSANIAPVATQNGDTFELPDGLPVGTYTVTLTATDSAGGKTTDTITVVVGAGSRTKAYLPLIVK